MLKRRFAITLLAVAVALTALAGCAPVVPSGPPAFSGTVSSLTPGDERPANLVVVDASQATSGTGGPKAQVTVETATLFFDAQGKSAKGSGIAVGSRVNVWFVGGDSQVRPLQGTASAIQDLGK